MELRKDHLQRLLNVLRGRIERLDYFIADTQLTPEQVHYIGELILKSFHDIDECEKLEYYEGIAEDE